MKATGLFVDNKMEGEWKFYRETGQLWQIGNFKDGKKNGPWVRYDKNDQLEYQETFENDKFIKKKQ
jgi:antitoxin component YwqK of YwqJK toxin-antitoxin module